MSNMVENVHISLDRWLNFGPVQNSFRQVDLKSRLPKGQAKIIICVEPCFRSTDVRWLFELAGLPLFSPLCSFWMIRDFFSSCRHENHLSSRFTLDRYSAGNYIQQTSQHFCQLLALSWVQLPLFSSLADLKGNFDNDFRQQTECRRLWRKFVQTQRKIWPKSNGN